MTTSKRQVHWKMISFVLALLCILLVGLSIFLIIRHKQDASTEQSDSTTVTAIVSGLVTNSNQEPIIASIEITDATTSEKTRIQTNLLGKYEVSLPIGTYEFTFSKGFEYERKSITVEIEDRLRKSIDSVILEKDVDWNSLGWYCGDLHQHTNYSDGYQDINEVFISDLANGLNWGLVTDHNSVDGTTEWLHGGALFSNSSTEAFVAIPGMEVTTEMGHYNSLGSSTLIDHSVEQGSTDIERIANEIKSSGGLAQVNHPFLTDGMGFENWELIEEFDTVEIWNGKGVTNEESNLQTKEKWFELLNAGIYLPITGGSDNHDITGNYPWRRENESEACILWIERGLYSGMPRNYVYCPEEVSTDAILQAVEEGHSFVTNGPLILFTMENAILGEHIPATDEASISIRLYDQRGLESAVLIEDGIIIQEFDVQGETDITISDTLSVKSDSWYVLEITGADGGYAITNPIFVD